jgi:hypothetical protein
MRFKADVCESNTRGYPACRSPHSPITSAAFSPLGPRGIASLIVYYGKGEFFRRVNAAVSHDGYEWHPLIQKFESRL